MRNKQYLHYTILLIVSLIAFWQLAFGIFTIPGCSIFHDFPIHFYNSECLRNGYLPLWNPYSALGFSQHSNPQTWYPISLIFEGLFDYMLILLQIEIVLQIFLAGIGFYYLAKVLKLSPEISLFCGITYMLSGFFVASPMWPGWIVSGTWIPFVIGSYIKLVRDKTLSSVLTLTISYFMLFSGGYLAFFIITGYILIGIFIYTIVKEFINKQIAPFWKTIKLNILFVISFLLCSLVIVFGYYDLQNELLRSGKLPLEWALYGSVTLESLISFLFPYSVVNGGDQWGELGTISNSYFGLFCFTLLILIPIWRKNKNAKILFVIGLFFLGVSLGQDLPIKKWLYHILPYIGYFMYNGMFRLFALIAFILVAGFSLQEISFHQNKLNLFKKSIYALSGLIFILFAITLIENKFNILISFNIDVIETMNLSQSLLANSIISIVILSGFILALRVKKIDFIYIIIVFSTIDLIVMAQLNASATIHSKTRVSNLQNELKGLPKGFPIPDNIPMNNKETFGYELQSIEHNKNVFRKQPSYFGSNSFGYSDYTFLNEYLSNDIKQSIIKNNLIYFPDSIYNFKTPYKINPTNFHQADKMNYTEKPLNNCKNVEIELTEFNPNSITFNCKTDTSGFLVLMQNYFTGWKAYINNNETNIDKVNFCMMGINVPKGNNKVTFKYLPNKIIVSMWISLISILLTITGLIILRRKEKMLSS